MMHGVVFDIKRFAVHDGPGIRTAVHFKGCPLKCLWCHNPEGIDPNPTIYKKEYRVASRTFSRDETIGKHYTSNELVNELNKDRVFWDESNGGVTFSGGEPLMQFSFAFETAQLLNEQAIHLALDTCGFVSTKKLEKIAPFVDLFLFDLKTINSKSHKQFTEKGNKLILENLNWLISANQRVEIRIPVIPGKNFDKQHLLEFINFLSGKKIQNLSLLPFHSIANHKYERLFMKNEMNGINSLPSEALSEWKQQFEKAGFAVNIGV